MSSNTTPVESTASSSSPVSATKHSSVFSSPTELLNAAKFWGFIAVCWSLIMASLFTCARLMLSATIAMVAMLFGGASRAAAITSTMSAAAWAAFAFGALLLFIVAWSFSLVVQISRSSHAPTMELQVPTKRNYHFAFAADKISNWHAGGFLITSFWNALSVFFPSGERMFMEAVRMHKHIIEEEQAAVGGNDKLLQAVNAFISQEAVHGREHECYNEILMTKYPAVRWMERLIIFLTEGLTKYSTKRFVLGATVSLEHWTAMLAGLMLNKRRYALSADDVDDEDGYSLVWKWHGMEEIEHRAVAFDVYRKAYPDTFRYYISRCISQVTTTFMFWTLIISCFIIVVASESPRYFLRFPEWIDLFYFQFRKPGVFAGVLHPLIDYFRRDFHPSQHNTEDYSKLYDELKDKVEKFHQSAKSSEADK